MAGVVIDEQFHAGPGPGQLPRGRRRAAQVEAAVDQHAGDPGQPPGVADHGAIGEKSAVGVVVRADPDEGQHVVIASFEGIGPTSIGPATNM